MSCQKHTNSKNEVRETLKLSKSQNIESKDGPKLRIGI